MGPIVGTGTLKVIRYRYSVLDFKVVRYRYSFQKVPSYFSGTRYFLSTLIKSKIPIFVLSCKIKSAMSVRIFVKGCHFHLM